MVVCSKNCKFLPNRWFFVFFHEMRHFLQLFPEKLIEMQRHGGFFKSCKVLNKSMVSRAFSRNEALSATFS